MRGKKYLIPCWFCTFAHWQRTVNNYFQSIFCHMCSVFVLGLLCWSVSLPRCFCLHFLSLVPVSLVCLFVSIVTLVCSYDNCPHPLVISFSLSVCVYLNSLVFTCVCWSLFHVSLYCSLDVPGFLFEDYEFFLSFCLFLIKVVHASGFSLSLIPTLHILNGRFILTVRDRITKKKIQKNTFQKSYKLICMLMSEISIWSPINQQDFWLPGVFYTGK